jgi:WD40 repeat protein
LWKAQTGEFVRELVSRGGYSPQFSPDGHWLVVSGNGGRTFSTASWSSIWTTDAITAAISPDNRLVAEMVEDGARLVEITSGKEIAFLEKSSLEGRAQISFSPDGNRLLVLHVQSGIEVWDLALIRHRLQAIDLDWNWPRPAPTSLDSPVTTAPLKLRFRDEISQM